LYGVPDLDETASHFGYASEEFGVYHEHLVTRAEYDDGAAVINGKPVDISDSVELRVRFLTPYNFIIAAHNSPLNSTEFDRVGADLLNGILRSENSVEELADAVRRLPKRQPMSYEYS
jgi:hypothetical protein